MNKVLKVLSIAMVILTVIIVLVTIAMCIVVKPHAELLGSWILTEEPVPNVTTTSLLYFYGYNNFKYDSFINLDYTGNEKSDEARGTYTIDRKNKKIKLSFENGNETEISYIDNDKIQLISDKKEEYTFVSNETSKALEEVFEERENFLAGINK